MQYVSQALHPNPNTKPRIDEHGVPIPTTVLITGATSGIGKAFAELFAKDQYNLVIVARNEEKLAATVARLLLITKGTVSHISCDLSTADAPKALVAEIKKRGLQIDILVNNAGHGRIEKILEQDIDSIAKINHLNVNTPTLLCRLLIPDMVKNGYGKVLNVGSIAAYLPGPVQAVYNASKAYLLSFSNALTQELKGSPVTATVICPGVTKTEFFDRGGVDGDKILSADVITMTAEEVALQGYNAFFRNEPQYICGFKNYVVSKLLNVVPSAVSAPIFQKANEAVKGSS